MKHEKKVALRYCGGCNPRFDRSGFVCRLQQMHPELTIDSFGPEGRYCAVLVVCGCRTQCAQQRDLPEGLPRLVVAMQEEYEKAHKFLDAIKYA